LFRTSEIKTKTLSKQSVIPNTPGTLTQHTWYLNIAHLVR